MDNNKAISKIVDWNFQAGLESQGMNRERITTQIGEELAELWGVPKNIIETMKPKLIGMLNSQYGDNKWNVSDALDDLSDIIVYTVGEMVKILNPICKDKEQVSETVGQVIDIVMDANFKKLEMKQKKFDEFGKLQKPDDFVPPDEEIKKLVNERMKENREKFNTYISSLDK